MAGLGVWWPVERPPVRSLGMDCAFAAASAYAGFVLATEAVQLADDPALLAPARLIAVLHGGSVALRRVSPPLAVLSLLGTATVFLWSLGLPVHLMGPAVLFVAYGSAVALDRRPAVLLLVVVVVAAVVLLSVQPAFPGWPSVVLYVAVIAAAWCLGAVVRRWRVLAWENGRRAEELERARLELARHAVAAERVRMARELHDVVAHSMSVVAMHAGAARLAVGTDPDGERAMLLRIESLSRSALDEMRRLVTFLRDQDGTSPAARRPAALDPAPSLHGLHELVSRFVGAGMEVEVETHGDLADVPPGVSLTGYRVVQEALTNVLRHAGPTRVRLTVRARAGILALCVENEPSATCIPTAPAPGGHGTLGMRERVELYGGSLISGPAAGGGWRVEAGVPYTRVGT